MRFPSALMMDEADRLDYELAVDALRRILARRLPEAAKEPEPEVKIEGILLCEPWDISK